MTILNGPIVLGVPAEWRRMARLSCLLVVCYPVGCVPFDRRDFSSGSRLSRRENAATRGAAGNIFAVLPLP